MQRPEEVCCYVGSSHVFLCLCCKCTNNDGEKKGGKGNLSENKSSIFLFMYKIYKYLSKSGSGTRSLNKYFGDLRILCSFMVLHLKV